MQGLGDLEALVMDELWSTDEPQSVHDLVARLERHKSLAYTTVLTVVTHLHDKGWVSRQKRGRAYFYTATESRAAATARAVRELLDSSADPAAVLLHFARTATARESDILRRGLSGESDQP
ncbi:BlaI/MecI/CopY family transcriptional regulator [Millisia brevis]|uniref:BlaI/MecI/CopY family transcriptional regulator n=1 Tax=Millisia brevis TaxID=264148 RepID=UPI00083472D9|nr:BlaI/MecI/CopY family transcriptional regulator [Millisia brevis]